MMAKRNGSWFAHLCDSVICIIMISDTEFWTWISGPPNESMKNTVSVAGFALAGLTQELRTTWGFFPHCWLYLYTPQTSPLYHGDSTQPSTCFSGLEIPLDLHSTMLLTFDIVRPQS